MIVRVLGFVLEAPYKDPERPTEAHSDYGENAENDEDPEYDAQLSHLFTSIYASLVSTVLNDLTRFIEA